MLCLDANSKALSKFRSESLVQPCIFIFPSNTSVPNQILFEYLAAEVARKFKSWKAAVPMIALSMPKSKRDFSLSVVLIPPPN